MDKPEDYMRNLKINLEETRQLSIWNGLLDAAFKEDNENIANGVLVGDEVTIFMGGENQPNAKFPVMIKRYSQWEIVHDFDNSVNNIGSPLLNRNVFSGFRSYKYF